MRSKILLLGDDICLGYRDYLKQILSGRFKVLYPKEHGRNISYDYRMIYEWHNELFGGETGSEVKFIYFNAGLWDVVHIYNNDAQTPLDEYTSYLNKMVSRLRYIYPKSKICFATTTPVLEAKNTYDFCRNNDEIEVYNRKAKEILKDKVDLIDDLYSVLYDLDEKNYIDGSLFSKNINIKIARHIASLVKSNIDSDTLLIDGIERNKNKINDVICKPKRTHARIWGGGYMGRELLVLFSKYFVIDNYIDSDPRLQGASICGILCISPEEALNRSDTSVIIIAVKDKEACYDIAELCQKNGKTFFEYKFVYEKLIRDYEELEVKRIGYSFENFDPKKKERMSKYVALVIPVDLCNFQCSYCCTFQPLRKDMTIPKLVHKPEFIRMKLSRKALGGSALIGMSGNGETFLLQGFNELCFELLKEGHYLHIVTNGVFTEKIRELLEQAGDYCKHIIFKLSFHYLQLKEKDCLDRFVETVNFIEVSDASYTIELMPHDELVEYIPEVKKYCIENFGALPQLTLGRDELKNRELLSGYSFDDYCQIWSEFKSEMFDVRKRLYLMRGRNCYAGIKSVYINLETGVVNRCLFNDKTGNIFWEDVDFDNISEVNNSCMLDYCFNCHIYAPLGVLQMDNIPTYYAVRDRKKKDGKSWIKEDMKRFLDARI